MSVKKYGLMRMRFIPGHRDEPLKGKRKGQRSVRLNRGYRLIYVELEGVVHIQVLEVNKHEY